MTEEDYKQDKTYDYEILCHNCSKMITLAIPKGERVVDFLEENKLCPHCSCGHGIEK